VFSKIKSSSHILPLFSAIIVAGVGLSFNFGGSNMSKQYWEYGFPFVYERTSFLGRETENFYVPLYLHVNMAIIWVSFISTYIITRKVYRACGAEPLLILHSLLLAFATLFYFVAPINLVLCMLGVILMGYINCVVLAIIMILAIASRLVSKLNHQAG
jgi:hypothetical protein